MSQPARTVVANASEGDASPQPGNKPVDKIRIGNVTANIWNNPSEKGDFHTVTFERNYKGEGDMKIVSELVQSDNCRLVHCFATADWLRSNEMNLKGKEDLVVEVHEKELERISTLVTPNQVLGVFTKPIFSKKRSEENLVLLLDTIQDPGNLGTILRTADWFGVRSGCCQQGFSRCI